MCSLSFVSSENYQFIALGDETEVNTNLEPRLEVLRGDAVAPVEGHARLAGLEDLASRARVRGAASAERSHQ